MEYSRLSGEGRRLSGPSRLHNRSFERRFVTATLTANLPRVTENQASVLRRTLDMIDHENFDRTLTGIELESEILLQNGD